MGVYGIAVLVFFFFFFSCGISVILIFTCGIAVSSSSAVCGFSSSWLTVFGEIRCSRHYGTVNDYTICGSFCDSYWLMVDNIQGCDCCCIQR